VPRITVRALALRMRTQPTLFLRRAVPEAWTGASGVRLDDPDQLGDGTRSWI